MFTPLAMSGYIDLDYYNDRSAISTSATMQQLQSRVLVITVVHDTLTVTAGGNTGERSDDT